VEEAVAEALKDLGIDAAEASVEVIEEPAKGFLGLGAREALVRVTAVARPADVAIGLIQDVLDLMDLDGDINVEIQDPYITVNVQGRDLGILIGRHGATLDALQFLANLAANKQAGNRVKVIVDVEGYRQRREEMLCKMALRTADGVARSRRGVALEPMNPQERRIVHLALKDHPDVVTESEGEDPYRKVIVLPRE
jgi:spoIIIJ-associated protein